MGERTGSRIFHYLWSYKFITMDTPTDEKKGILKKTNDTDKEKKPDSPSSKDSKTETKGDKTKKKVQWVNVPDSPSAS
ncbi:unnamed protein product [Fusarium graminearum]|nr:unnamed protein product [Fusarium graminearum]CAG2002906.1 unnamed protein product [Fusarium graminearum]